MKPIIEKLSYYKAAPWLISVLVAAFTAIFGTGSYANLHIFERIDHFFYDRFILSSPTHQASSGITIIDVDETSLSSVGQWPWPRYRIAQLVKKINDLNPSIIGFDIVLPESDRTSLNNIQSQFQKDFDLTLGFTGVPASLKDNDAFLAQVFKQSPLIGSRYFYFDHYNKEASCFYSPFDISDPNGLLNLHSANGILCNIPEIENALQFTGFTNNQYDKDGIIRKTPLLMTFKGQIFTHFSFSSFLKLKGIEQADISKDPFGLHIKAGQYKIPITPEGYIHMRFSGPARRYKYISAVEILTGNYLPEDITGNIIFIGSSAIGLNDVHHTVYDALFPGVEINAVIVDNINHNRLITTPVWSRAFIFSLCILTGLIMAVLMFKLYGPKPFFIVAVAWMAILFFSSLFLFFSRSIFISPGQPILLTLLYFSIFSFIRLVQTRQASLLWFKKLASSQQLTMEAMVSLVETRDPETGQHIKRTQHYAKNIADYLKQAGRFPEILTDEYVEMLFLSVPLHDIGKVGIPDRVLLKPAQLSEEEFELMKLHTSIGKKTIERAASNIHGDNYLKLGAEIAGSHHERWDGKGYPEGLVGEDIPLSGRIMAIADVYDALISRRCYKPPFPHDKAMNLIREGKGTFFDPVIVEAFFAVEADIQAIASKFKDKIEETSDELKKIYMGVLPDPKKISAKEEWIKEKFSRKSDSIS